MIANMMSLETFIVVNFKAHRINRGTYKLIRTPTLIKKSNKENRSLSLIIKAKEEEEEK